GRHRGQRRPLRPHGAGGAATPPRVGLPGRHSALGLRRCRRRARAGGTRSDRRPRLGRQPLPQRLEPGGGHVSAKRSGSLLALATLSVVATLGFARLFNDASWVLPVLLAAVGAHGIGLATRRWPAPLALAASAVAMGLLLCAVVAGHTTFYGLPTASTLSALGRGWSAGLDSFRNAVAPTKTTPGLLLLSVGGTWICAAAADWLAFRGDATLTAILPPFVLYVMGAALGKDGFQLPTTFVFAVAALLFVAARHAAGLPSAWFSGR